METPNKEASYGPEMSWEQFSFVYGVIQDGTAKMVGEVLQIIEALGLKESQETAIKKLIKGTLWNIEQSVMDSSIRRLVPENQQPRLGEKTAENN